jgi:hypothetical protein
MKERGLTDKSYIPAIPGSTLTPCYHCGGSGRAVALGRELSLGELRKYYGEYLIDFVTSEESGASKRTCDKVQGFLEGGKLPKIPYYRDPLAWLLQANRISNRLHLWDICDFFE